MTTLYPMGYGNTMAPLDVMMAELLAHGHPEYIRRIKAWFIAQGGKIGIGDAWRATGTQPSLPGFAPEGRSFHQDQKFTSGFIGSCAVDLVVARDGLAHRSPTWSEVPQQGSVLAVKWGLHCNIVPSEPWHMQPIEIDGWQSWVDAGRKDPVANYPLPVLDTVPGGNVLLYKIVFGDSPWKICEKVYADGKATMARAQAIIDANPDNPVFNPGEIISIPGRVAS